MTRRIDGVLINLPPGTLSSVSQTSTNFKLEFNNANLGKGLGLPLNNSLHGRTLLDTEGGGIVRAGKIVFNRFGNRLV